MLQVIALLHPRGRLNAAVLWPRLKGESKAQQRGRAEGIVQAYLAEGYSKAAAADPGDQDEAATQWTYYRAWDEVYQRLLHTPSSVSVGDEGSSSYALAQIEHIGEMAAEAKATFEALVPEAIVVEEASFGVIQSYR